MLAIKRFMGAFWACIILFAGFCGFAVIDLSSELYMPGRFGSLLRLNSLDENGIELELMGENYHISLSAISEGRKLLEPWHPLLPAAPQLAAAFTEQLYHRAEEYLEQRYSTESMTSVIFDE